MHPKDLGMMVSLGQTLAAMSTATRLKVGSVIFDPDTRNIISVGYNGTPPGEDNICEVDGVTKDNVIHAEINALKKTDRIWYSPPTTFCADDELHVSEGKVLYTTSSPCADCAIYIVDYGISRVLFLKRYEGATDGIRYLLENNIVVERVVYDGNKGIWTTEEVLF
jgi:dCMP deaminase